MQEGKKLPAAKSFKKSLRGFFVMAIPFPTSTRWSAPSGALGGWTDPSSGQSLKGRMLVKANLFRARPQSEKRPVRRKLPSHLESSIRSDPWDRVDVRFLTLAELASGLSGFRLRDIAIA
jgi:hypothetical protein